MSEFGPNKKETTRIALDLIALVLASIAFSLFIVSAVQENNWTVPLIVPSAGIIVLEIMAIFNEINQLSLRIRLEESDARMELLSDIREEMGWGR